jgi:AcrR family transcriptional regulator
MAQQARGRRPGQPDTRAVIVEAARRRFLTAGYADVTLRSVAEEAGVDVALLSYYFGSKRGLFVEALAAVEEPGKRMAEAIAGGDLAGLPARLLREVLRVWDDERGVVIKAILTAAPQAPEIRDLYARAVERSWNAPLAARLGCPDAEQRAAAFTLVMSGVIYTRHLLRIEPIASMPAEDVVGLISPVLAAALATA